jgi:hypothetical protein
MIRSNLLSGFLSQVLGSAILPPRVDLFLQRNDSVDQPMGGYTDSDLATLLQGIDLIG